MPHSPSFTDTGYSGSYDRGMERGGGSEPIRSGVSHLGRHHRWCGRNTAKITISISVSMLNRLDELESKARYPSRSGAIRKALQDLLDRTNATRLARECSKLIPEEEIPMAEEGMDGEIGSWPEY